MSQETKRIVLKFGSGVLTTPSGNALDTKQFKRLAAEIAGIARDGHECIVVSSGAVAAGLGALGFEERPDDLSSRQACAAVGQSKLMRAYETVFATHRLHVAQLLLTHGDLDSRARYQNAKNTLKRLLKAGDIVPIINENDSVAVEELKFGDNDRLSAEVAIMAGADLLILLTSVDGLMDAAGEVVSVVPDIESVTNFVNDNKGRFSVGGMRSKLGAVRLAIDAGIRTVIASGRRAGQISAIVTGKSAGTRFVARGES